MTVLSKSEIENIFIEMQELHRCCEDIENGTALTFAGGTIDVPSSDVTDGKNRANTLLGTIQTSVSALTDIV